MSRPRLTIGTYGEITTRRRPSGRIEARARYRDWDGATRLVQASGDTAAAAIHALKAKCVDRNLIAPSAGSLTADSPFPDLVAYWLEDIELGGPASDRHPATVRARHAHPRAARI